MDPILDGKWFSLSLVEQMVNIGNEVKRAVRFDANREKKDRFLDNAIRFTELTMSDPKNARVVPELQMGKAVLEDYRGEHRLDCTKEQIARYYNAYTYLL